MKWASIFTGLGIITLLQLGGTPAKGDVITIGVIPPTPFPSRCTPPPAGLVAWWPAEGSAADMADTNTGTITGGVTYGEGKVGNAFVFFDTNAAVEVQASPSLDVGQSSGFTLEAWINPAVDDQAMPIFEWNNGTAHGVHFWVFNSGNILGNVVDSNGGDHILISDANVITNGIFQHVALTYDQSNGVATLYCNGVMVGQSTIGSFTPLTSYDLYLGQRPPGNPDATSFAGTLDEMSVYNRALSQDELLAIYNAGSAGKCQGPVPPMFFTEPSSQTAEEGSAVTLSGSAGGTAPLQYQWLLFGGIIPGATNATLTLTDLHADQAGNYQLKVTNGGGTTNSPIATLTVTAENILAYTFTGSEDLVTKGSEFSYKFSGEMFFIPALTNGTFVGWATIQGKRQYWVTPFSDFHVVNIPGNGDRSYTLFGKAGTVVVNNFTHLWSYVHTGLNERLKIGTHLTFSFPKVMTGDETHVYPDSQAENMILTQASSKFEFSPQVTEEANNRNETMQDMINALTAKLRSEGYKAIIPVGAMLPQPPPIHNPPPPPVIIERPINLPPQPASPILIAPPAPLSSQ